MTTDQFILKLNRQMEAIIKQDRPLMIAVRDIMAIQSERIFRKGLNSNEAPIGKYIGKGMYAGNSTTNPLGIKNVPAGKLKGKTGERKFKNGKLHKTGYFESFLMFKKAIGKNATMNTVDLFLSGKLHRNWANAEIKQPPKAIKLNQHNYIVSLSEENQNKVERYGKVFNLSIRERGIFLSRIQQELIKALK